MRNVEILEITSRYLSGRPAKTKVKCEGYFHTFSTYHDEYDDSYPPKPVAIVELHDGSIEVVESWLIRFIGGPGDE